MVERTPIQSQERFGPAQSRARVFSVFAPVRPNEDAGKAAKDISEILGATAEYASQQELEQAQQERDEGLRDYVSGLVQDGQRIVNGEMQPIESRYYMAGVEMGMGRTKGRRVWQSFTEWQADNPRPGLDSDMSYEEWLEAGLAFAQEEAGVDPDNMSVAMSNEYAGIINQIRQRDNEQLVAQLNREAVAEQTEAFNSDVASLQESFDPYNIDETYAAAEAMMARGRAVGLDPEAMRRQFLTTFTNIARENRDVSVLEDVPQGVLRSASVNAALMDSIRAVEREIEADQYAGEANILNNIHELIQSGEFDRADDQLAAAFEADAIRTETRMNWDSRILNARQAAAVEARAASTRASNRALESVALLDAMNEGTLGGGVSYTDADGEDQYISPERVAERYQALVFSEMGRGADAYARLTTLTEQHGLVFPAAENFFRSALEIPQVRLETGELTEAQAASVNTLLQTNPNVLSAYMDSDDHATVTTAQFLYQTGAYEASEALGMATRTAGVIPNPDAAEGYANRIAGELDWNKFTGPWRMVDLSPLAVNPLNDVPVWRGTPGENFDRDTAAGRRWSREMGRQAAAIEQVAGREAAEAFFRDAAENTMVVNRQPVNAIGPMRGPEGEEFLPHLMASVAIGHLAPELDFGYEGWWSAITGHRGEWNPNDPELQAIMMGHIDVEQAPGGLRFRLDEAQSYLTNQQILSMYQAHRRAMERQAADNADDGLIESRTPGLVGAAADLFERYSAGRFAELRDLPQSDEVTAANVMLREYEMRRAGSNATEFFGPMGNPEEPEDFQR